MGDFTNTSSRTYPIVSSKMITTGAGNGVVGDVFEGCELKLNSGALGQFDDGLQFSINGTHLLNFDQCHWSDMPEFQEQVDSIQI